MLEEVRRNAFNVERTLGAYRQMLGREFTDFLKTMPEGAHWIDAGAGRAQAVADYLDSADYPTKVRTTAVTLVPPEGLDIAALETRLGPQGFRYVHGQPIEEIPPATLGPADLVTDVYGPLQYSRQIDQVFTCYGQLLKPGGRLWARVPVITTIKDGDREVPFAFWLANLKGFRATKLPTPGLPENEIVMIRTDDAVQVPPLFLARVVPGPPPMREYMLLGR